MNISGIILTIQYHDFLEQKNIEQLQLYKNIVNTKLRHIELNHDIMTNVIRTKSNGQRIYGMIQIDVILQSIPYIGHGLISQINEVIYRLKWNDESLSITLLLSQIKIHIINFKKIESLKVKKLISLL